MTSSSPAPPLPRPADSVDEAVTAREPEREAVDDDAADLHQEEVGVVDRELLLHDPVVVDLSGDVDGLPGVGERLGDHRVHVPGDVGVDRRLLGRDAPEQRLVEVGVGVGEAHRQRRLVLPEEGGRHQGGLVDRLELDVDAGLGLEGLDSEMRAAADAGQPLDLAPIRALTDRVVAKFGDERVVVVVEQYLGALRTQCFLHRLHVHVAVEDLAKSVSFYSTLFGAQPAVMKNDYAKWMLDDPRVNFAISQKCGAAKGVGAVGRAVIPGDSRD